jgi:hypothetical protein
MSDLDLVIRNGTGRSLGVKNSTASSAIVKA